MAYLHPEDRLRLLIALELPEPVRHGIERWREQALTDPALRLTELLRIDLLFLGHRPRQGVGEYLEAIRKLCAKAPAPLIELGDAVPKGQPSRPRLFALPVSSTQVEAFRLSLRSVLEAKRLSFCEQAQRFWPHLTLARVRTEEGSPRRPRVLRDTSDLALPEELQRPFRAPSIGLYSSELRLSGARYELLGRAGQGDFH
jgi:2'-5' RNA ligase